MSLKFGSVSSGIEAASVAWEPLGWKAQFFSEIAPFPCKVLNYRFPEVPNLGDMLLLTQNQQFNDATIDLLVGGTPCQSFSLAGLRAGLNSANGNLALEYCRLLKAKRPRWFVWENVPGVFSSFSNETFSPDNSAPGSGDWTDITETADFASLLSAFRECGYSCAWRVLDAQFFGVPQRRRRVFVIGYLGDDWRPPAAVLFDSESLSRNIKKGKKEGENIAATVTGRSTSCSPAGGSIIGNIIPCYWDGGQISQTLDAVLHKGQTMPEKNRFPAVIYPMVSITNITNRSNPTPGDPAPTVGTDSRLLVVPGVRRLTPLECERLQGFPDDWTKIPGAKDSPRYKSIGNSMAVPVMNWIGRRIQIVDDILTGKI